MASSGLPISVAERSRAPNVIEEENSCGPLQMELRVDDPALRAAIAPFKGVPHAQWKKKDVLLAVPILRNRRGMGLFGRVRRTVPVDRLQLEVRW